jgi:hypothetical protein
MRDPSEENIPGDLSDTEANGGTATTGDAVGASSSSGKGEELDGSTESSAAPGAPRIANLSFRSGAIVALAAFGLVLRLWLIFGWRFLEEDALITLRYAKNLWTGAGLVYNADERVMGFTSPLWTFLTAPIVGTLPISEARYALGLLGLVFFSGAFVSLLYLAIKRLHIGDWGIITLAAFLAVEPRLVAESVSGMEMSLFLFLLSIVLLAFDTKRFYLAFGAASLAFLTRPEGAILWLICFIYCLARFRFFPIKQSVIPSLIIVAPWLAFSTLYYGSPFAQSALSKSMWSATGFSFSELLFRPADLDLLWRNMIGLYVLKPPPVVRGLIVAFTVAVFAVVFELARRRGSWPILLAMSYFLALLGFYYFGKGLFFPWYSVPTIAIFALVMATGIDTVVERALGEEHEPGSFESISSPRRSLRSDSPQRLLTTLAGTAIVIALLLGFVLRLLPWRDVRTYEDTVLAPTGAYLAACTPSDSIVMLEPLGYIGYYSQRRVLDLAGLVSPQFRPSRAKFQPGWGADQILKWRPEFVVLRQYEVPDNRFFASLDAPMFRDDNQREEFTSLYRPIKHFGSEWRTDLSLVVYARRDVPLYC